MAGIKVANGTAASAEQTVDTNGDAHVRTPQTEANAGFVQLSAEIDSGSVTGSRYVKALEVSEDYRLRVGIDTPLFNHSFEGTAVAQDRFSQVVSTHAIAQASGYLTLNSAASTAAGHAVVRSYRAFPLVGSCPVYVEMWMKPVNETATNSVTEFGIGYALTTAAPTDGAFFRYNAGGQLMGVVSYAGAETTVNLTSPTTNQCHHYLISTHNEETEFWINDVLMGSIATPTSYPAPYQSSEQPFYARVYATGVMSLARSLSIGFINVTVGDSNSSKPWGHIQCGSGGGSYQIQPGTASGPTVTRGAAQTGWPTSATAQTGGAFTTATTSPGYNTLGGYFVTAAISGMTANADYPIYSYLNPAGTNALPGKTLYITGFRLGELNAQVAPVTLTTLIFGLGVGSTSANTTATEGAAIVAARVIPVGACTFLAADAIGTTRGGWTLDLSSAPLVVPPNTYVHLIMRATVITSVALTVLATATFIGYHE